MMFVATMCSSLMSELFYIDFSIFLERFYTERPQLKDRCKQVLCAANSYLRFYAVALLAGIELQCRKEY